MKERLSSVALAIILGVFPAACEKKPTTGAPQHDGHASSATAPAGSAVATVYACPMHPEVMDTKASACPKCGMTLVAVQPDGGATK
ncbi:MAG: hypothetical protein IT377_05750 [Polyangiaceae bacterium]|nr:hypothetical protein [Polyangiaceae bacterium]